MHAIQKKKKKKKKGTTPRNKDTKERHRWAHALGLRREQRQPTEIRGRQDMAATATETGMECEQRTNRVIGGGRRSQTLGSVPGRWLELRHNKFRSGV